MLIVLALGLGERPQRSWVERHRSGQWVAELVVRIVLIVDRACAGSLALAYLGVAPSRFAEPRALGNLPPVQLGWRQALLRCGRSRFRRAPLACSWTRGARCGSSKRSLWCSVERGRVTRCRTLTSSGCR